MTATSVNALIANVDSAEPARQLSVALLLHYTMYIPPKAVYLVRENDLVQQRKDGLQPKVSYLISPDGTFKHIIKAIGVRQRATIHLLHIYTIPLASENNSKTGIGTYKSTYYNQGGSTVLLPQCF